MKPSPRCIAFIKSFEKCKLVAYMPTKNDRPTLGWGSTGRDIKMGMTWTQEQADARFDRDLAMFAAGVEHLIGGAPTNQAQFDAMVSFAYNVGLDDDGDGVAEGFGDSTLLKKHKSGDFKGAADQFKFWNKQKGVVLAGLTRRRGGEAAMYRGEL